MPAVVRPAGQLHVYGADRAGPGGKAFERARALWGGAPLSGQLGAGVTVVPRLEGPASSLPVSENHDMMWERNVCIVGIS